MKKLLLLTLFSFLMLSLNAQYYYLPPVNTGLNPGDINQSDDEFPLGGGLGASWVLVQGPNASPTFSPVQTIPFTFNFNGNAVTQYKVSTSGVLTFTTSAISAPSTSNTALPSASIPDASVMVWGLTGSGSNDNIVKNTFGTAPNRQHWVTFSSYSYPGLGSWTYFSIVLEEGSDKIYIVDQRNNNVPASVNLTIGIQIDGSTAIQDVNSPNAHPNAQSSLATRADNYYWEFIPGSQPQYDFALNSFNMPTFNLVANAPFTIDGSLTNLGSETITSFDINYSIDGGPVQTDPITGVNISQLGMYNYMSAIPWSPVIPKAYTVTVWTSNLNGNIDENTANDSITSVIQIIDRSLERNALHEVFTSSTCAPCAPGNANTDAVWAASTETPVIIKYQMSWPGTGDPYYTLEGLARRTYYGVNSVPNMQIDGGWDGNSNSYTAGILNQYSAIPSFLEIGGNYNVSGQTMDIQLAINPLTNLPGNNILHVAIIEKSTINNVKSNGETIFYDVMKKMVPDASGTSIGSIQKGVPLTYAFSYTFNGNYRLSNNAGDPINHATEHSIEDFTDLDIVVWVQNQTTKEVYHSSYGMDQLTSLDASLNALNVPDSAGTGWNVSIGGTVTNFQTTQVTSYDVIYKINGGLDFRETVSGLTMNPGDFNNFTHSNTWVPSNPGFYKVEVRIDNVNGAGIGVADDLAINDHAFTYITVVDGLTSSIPSYELAKSIKVYPNPSTGIFNIDSKTSLTESVEIYSLMGRKIETIQMGSKGLFSMDLSDYAKGTYIIKFNSKGGAFSQRIVLE